MKMQRLMIFLAELLAVSISAAEAQSDFFKEFERVQVAVASRGGQQSIRLICDVPFFSVKDFCLSANLHNFLFWQKPFGQSFIWSKFSFRKNNFYLEYKLLHNWPDEWDILEGKRVSQLRVDYIFSKKIKSVFLCQRFGRVDILKCYFNYQLEFLPASLDVGFYSIARIHTIRPAGFVRLKYDFIRFDFLSLSSIFEKYQKQQNHFWQKLFRQVEDQTCLNQPVHSFLP